MFKAATLRNQLLLNDKHVFYYTYSRAKLHDATPKKKKKKNLIMKNQRKSIKIKSITHQVTKC